MGSNHGLLDISLQLEILLKLRYPSAFLPISKAHLSPTPRTQVSWLPLGTKTSRSSSFELEMSQEGFSAVLTPVSGVPFRPLVWEEGQRGGGRARVAGR